MQAVLLLLAAYAAAGLLFALLYAAKIAPARDPALRASPIHVRALLIPAALALWPLLLTPPKERPETPVPALRRRHLALWAVIAPLTLAALALALALRSAAP